VEKKRFITIYCAANKIAENYTAAAIEFVGLMRSRGYHLVWGGSDTGLMLDISSEAKKDGGYIVGISIAEFADVARADADELITAPSLGERKRMMMDRGDAFLVLPGGIGTLDELMEVTELKKEEKHNKPIVVLNTDHFYDALNAQLQKMQQEGFMHKPIDSLVYFAETPLDAIEHISRAFV
jgi:uncharacterized protein (TIGR00730 family)